MQILFLLPAMLLSAATAEAQVPGTIPAGTVALQGGVGYNHSRSTASTTASNSSSTGSSSTPYQTDSKTRYFGGAPAVSYFMADNLAIGLQAGYTNLYREDAHTSSQFSAGAFQSSGSSTQTTWQIGAFVQYYCLLTPQFGLTGNMGLGYQRMKSNGASQDDSYQRIFLSRSDAAGCYANLTPGVIYFPVPRFSISATSGALRFDHLRTDQFSYNSYGNGESNSSQQGVATNSEFGARFGLD